MIHVMPLTVVPLVAYNLVGYSLSGADPWASRLFGVTMLSGAPWSMTIGDLLIVVAVVMLFFEVKRAAGPAGRSVWKHLLSTAALIVYVGEFVAVDVAAHSVFFILTVLALFDVAAGFSIAIATARRNMAADRLADETL